MGYKKWVISIFVLVLMLATYSAAIVFFGGDGSSEDRHCLPFKIFCTNDF